MHDVTLVQEKFGEIGAVLTGNTSYQCDFGLCAHDCLYFESIGKMRPSLSSKRTMSSSPRYLPDNRRKCYCIWNVVLEWCKQQKLIALEFIAATATAASVLRTTCTVKRSSRLQFDQAISEEHTSEL